MSPLVLFNLHPRPLCSYACLNMELRELKPPVFTSRRVPWSLYSLGSPRCQPGLWAWGSITCRPWKPAVQRPRSPPGSTLP